MTLFMAIDVGTTNWKVGVFDIEGNLITIQTKPTITHNGRDGHLYYDPIEIWNNIINLMRKCVEETKNIGSILTVSVTGMGEAVVPLDTNGSPTDNIIPWFDKRSIYQANEIKKKIGEEKIFDITGLDCNPSFSLSKILWFKKHKNKLFNKTKKWLPVVDYINYKLSGIYMTDYTMASRTMMLDINNNDWSSEIIETYNIDIKSLPVLAKSGTVLGKIHREISLDTGLDNNVKIIVGGHDHLCGTLAAGVEKKGKILDSSGTAESIIGISDIGEKLPKEFKGLRLGRYLDPRKFVTWGGIITSGKSVDWLADLMSIDYKTFDKGASETNITGLMYLPHLRGCGAPHWNPMSKASFIGLEEKHSKKEMSRAVLEGLSYEIRLIIELTQEMFRTNISTINTIGGGARSDIWQQIKADVTGKKIEVPEIEEATLKGAALIGGIGLGVYKDFVDASTKNYKIKKTYEPDMKNLKYYTELFEIYKNIYPALAEINLKLSKLNKRRDVNES